MEAAAMRQRTLRAMELGGALAGAPAGGVFQAVRHVGQVVVDQHSSWRAPGSWKTIGGERVQRRLAGPPRERGLASAHHAHHAQQAF